MNLPAFLDPFSRKPERVHTVTRYHAATKAESKLARRKAIDRQLELAVAVCHLTPEQRKAAMMRAANRGVGREGVKT